MLEEQACNFSPLAIPTSRIQTFSILYRLFIFGHSDVDDVIIAGSSDDILQGKSGNNGMTGGAGDDIFI